MAFAPRLRQILSAPIASLDVAVQRRELLDERTDRYADGAIVSSCITVTERFEKRRSERATFSSADELAVRSTGYLWRERGVFPALSAQVAPRNHDDTAAALAAANGDVAKIDRRCNGAMGRYMVERACPCDCNLNSGRAFVANKYYALWYRLVREHGEINYISSSNMSRSSSTCRRSSFSLSATHGAWVAANDPDDADAVDVLDRSSDAGDSTPHSLSSGT